MTREARWLAVVVAALLLAACDGERARHLAVPMLSDPSQPVAAGVELPELRQRDGDAAQVAQVGSRVTALLETQEGDLLVGTFDGGLHRVYCSCVDLPGPAAPAGGERGGDTVADVEDEGLRTVREVPGLAGRQRFVNALAEHDGLAWVATQGGLLALDGDRWVIALLAGEGVTALARAGGALYAGTARGIFRVSVADGAEAIAAAGPHGEPLRVSALAASGGWLFVGTASGAYSLPLASVEAPLLARTARWHPLVFGDPPADTNVVTALAPLDGGVLVGTDDGGVVRLRDDGRVSALRFADARANEVNPGAAAAIAGRAAVGTQGGGLLVVRASGEGLAAVRAACLARAEVSAVAAAGEAVLVGTADGRVVRLTRQHSRPRRPGGPDRE